MQPRVVGVLNVTPDSFSDGGRYLDVDAAVEHGIHLTAAGADLVDVGGESTRPGAGSVPVDEELRRIVPVVRQLAAHGVQVGIDTRRAAVAAAALDAGATLVNDVSAGVADPAMRPLIAAAGCDYVLMHSRGPAAADGHYGDVVADVAADLTAHVEDAVAAGVSRARLIIDPGIGFTKTPAENWRTLAHLDRIRVGDLRVMVGVSRKRFLGQLLPPGAPVTDRDPLTAALTVVLAQHRVWAVRVHDVLATRRALSVLEQLQTA